jgi:hypothetical protein
MDAPTSQLDLLLDLDTRHDDLLARLEALDKQVEKVLADCLTVRNPAEAEVSGRR